MNRLPVLHERISFECQAGLPEMELRLCACRAGPAGHAYDVIDFAVTDGPTMFGECLGDDRQLRGVQPHDSCRQGIDNGLALLALGPGTTKDGSLSEIQFVALGAP